MCFLVYCLAAFSPAAAAEKFDYRKVIAKPIKAMGKPKLWEGVGTLDMVISSSSDEAEEHVKQGFALLHAQWDIEAYRHFAAAIELDNDCLMAYCGVVLSLLNPEHEWKAHRNIAINRMITLCEHQQMFGKKGEEGAGMIYTFPKNERGFAIAIAQLTTVSFAKGKKSIIQLADMFPNDIQFGLMAPFLSRGKYNIFGQPNPAQESAVKRVKEIMEKHPDNPLTINFYIMMLIEAPYNAVNQKQDVLPYARKIVEISKGKVPTWHMLHGYSAWRAGELEEAKQAYEKAMKIYESWKKQTKANMSESDGLMRAYSFLAVIYNELGDHKKADLMQAKMATAKHTRKSSQVYAVYEWNQQFLKARMLFAKAATGDKKALDSALKALPKIQSNNEDLKHFNRVIKGYQAYGLSCLHLQNGKQNESLQMASQLGKIIYELQVLAKSAQNKTYYSHYLISLKTLQILHQELSGLREEKGGIGVNIWYNQAIDNQLGPSRLFPPNILYPMEYRLAKYYESQKEYKKAMVNYDKALKRMGSHRASKQGFDRANAKVLELFKEKMKKKKPAKVNAQ